LKFFSSISAMRKAGISVLLLVLASATQACFDSMSWYAEGAVMAEKNSETSVGKAYDAELGEFFGVFVSPVVAKCIDSIPRHAGGRFSLVIQIMDNGSVGHVAANMGTPLSACLSEKLKEMILPKPPRPDYWVKMNYEG
jgi:hypothetical protein